MFQYHPISRGRQTVTSDPQGDRIERAIIGALRLREKHGRHMHHSQCIHNLPPQEQVAMRGRTVERWLEIHGSLPTQITPDQWEIDAPNLWVEHGSGVPTSPDSETGEQ